MINYIRLRVSGSALIGMREGWKRFLQQFGYWGVAVGCAFAGYSLSTGGNGLRELVDPATFLRSQERFEIMLLCGFILPSYVMFHVLYPGGIEDLEVPERVQGTAWAYWIYQSWMMCWLLLLTLLPIYLRRFSLCSLVVILIASCPFHIWSIWLGNHVTGNSAKRLWFRYRTFMPSLITVAVPFTFGWAVPIQCTFQRLAPLILILLIIGVAGWVLPKFSDGNRILLRLGCLIVLALFALTLLGKSVNAFHSLSPLASIFQALFFAILMTIMLGIVETSCVTARVTHNLQPVPDQPLVQRDLHLSNSPTTMSRFESGTNAAIAFVLPLYMASAMHPSANLLYVGLMFTFVFFFQCIWIYGSRPSKHRSLNCRWGRVVGYLTLLLMIFVGVGTKDSLPIQLSIFNTVLVTPGDVLIVPFAFIAASLGVALGTPSSSTVFRDIVSGRIALSSFSSRKYSLHFSLVVAGVGSFVTWLLWLLAEVWLPASISGGEVRPRTLPFLIILLLLGYQLVTLVGTKVFEVVENDK